MEDNDPARMKRARKLRAYYAKQEPDLTIIRSGGPKAIQGLLDRLENQGQIRRNDGIDMPPNETYTCEFCGQAYSAPMEQMWCYECADQVPEGM